LKPALSIVFFTVSSGAGLGLIALVALVDWISPGTLPTAIAWRSALLGLALVAAGLASSVLHLAAPRNAWRALSRVKTSWLSREAALAALLFPVAAIFARLVATNHLGSARAGWAVATLLLAWATLLATAMIYGSLKPIRQWRTIWTPVNYFLLGHWSGALLLIVMSAAYGMLPRAFVATALVLGAAALAAKLAYWAAIGDKGRSAAKAPTLERAIGVPAGVHGPGAMSVAQARLLDVGHSHGTFLTQEFGFELARRHARTLRIAALVLGFGLPAIWLLAGAAQWGIGLAATACGMIGLLAERWLFFAEARHTVRLYHGDLKT
jgi:DMSO reductase anchor subunit